MLERRREGAGRMKEKFSSKNRRKEVKQSSKKRGHEV